MEVRKREKTLVIAAAICVAIFVGDRLVLSPLQALWTQHKARIAELEQSLNRGGALLGREAVLNERWQEMKKRCLPFDMAAAENQTLKSVDAWARQSRLAMSSLKPRRTDDGEDLKKVEFQASAQGSMESICRFLYQLEKSPQALRVEEMGIASRDGKGDSLTLTLRFSGLLSLEKESQQK